MLDCLGLPYIHRVTMDPTPAMQWLHLVGSSL
ncbi:hypothetical protein CBM2587_B60311 [Cupriavidus taiwanensis]|uniref:Uncharacterized protein n=1 Tax=Cupriavidus taiwanensis TaxID=164546 RepID=A0A375C680_9BURK|nr:hypothetical protein CBM2587_B60311 [Cupriavidus taiwanensis]